MINLDNQIKEQQQQALIINAFHEKQSIDAILQAQKYHSILQLQLSLQSESQIQLMQKCLTDLTHLSSFSLIFNNYSLSPQYSIQNMFKPLKFFQNLKKFELKVKELTRDASLSEMLVEIANTIQYLPQLETLSIAFPDSRINNKGLEQFRYTFDNLKNLKDLQLKIRIDDDDDNYNNFNEILISINSIQSLTHLAFIIYTHKNHYFNEEILWSFNNLNYLQDLSLASNANNMHQIIRIAEQLRELPELKRLQLKMRTFNSGNDVNKLFNSVLNLKKLEELTVSLEILVGDAEIQIGEEVNKEIHLKVLSLNFYIDHEVESKGRININKGILSIKHLDKFEIDIDNFSFSDESYRVLYEWKNQWKSLEEFSFSSSSRSEEEIHKISVLLKGCFFDAKYIIKLRIELNLHLISNKSDFLKGLAQLKNLKSLVCQNLFEKNNQDICQQSKLCFQSLSHLRELNFGCINNNEEFLCIGYSFEDMKSLEILKITFGKFQNWQHFGILSSFLKKLSNLKSLYFEYKTEVFLFTQRFLMKSDDIQILLESISALRRLKQLILLTAAEKNSNETFNVGLNKITSECKQLNILILNHHQVFDCRRFIQRNLIKLVKLSSKF